jgi:hypothetical protein
MGKQCKVTLTVCPSHDVEHAGRHARRTTPEALAGFIVGEAIIISSSSVLINKAEPSITKPQGSIEFTKKVILWPSSSKQPSVEKHQKMNVSVTKTTPL